jgi:hypothetical protein
VLAGIGVALKLKQGSKTETTPTANTPQEEALNKYFSAINSFDFDAIEVACYPQEVIDSYDGNIITYRVGTSFYTDCLGLNRGPIDLWSNDGSFWLGMDPAKYFCVWKSYPKTSTYYNVLQLKPDIDEDIDDDDEYEEKRQQYSEKYQEYSEIEQSESATAEILDDLNVTYNLLSIKKLQDCTVTCKDDDNDLSRREIDAEWINDLINCGDEKVNVSEDDIYVACIQVKWSYGDKLYGWDETWWENSDFVEWITYKNITSRNTYDSIIEEYANREYVVFIYEYNDKWYVMLQPYLTKSWIGNSSGYDFEIE